MERKLVTSREKQTIFPDDRTITKTLEWTELEGKVL